MEFVNRDMVSPTGGLPWLEHIKEIGSGGFSDVHEVLSQSEVSHSGVDI